MYEAGVVADGITLCDYAFVFSYFIPWWELNTLFVRPLYDCQKLRYVCVCVLTFIVNKDLLFNEIMYCLIVQLFVRFFGYNVILYETNVKIPFKA